MSIEGGFPVRQPDGTYRIHDMEPAVAEAVWGTARYWARSYGLLEVATAFRERLIKEFPFCIFVEEGGCAFLIFPEKAALVVREGFLRERAKWKDEKLN